MPSPGAVAGDMAVIVSDIQQLLAVVTVESPPPPPSMPCPAAFEHPFTHIFFNETCLATAALPFPCATRVADSFVSEMSGALTVDSLLARQVSVVFMFSLNQLGGMPVPRPDCPHVSVGFFWTWMQFQFLQWVMAFHLVALEFVAFDSARNGATAPRAHGQHRAARAHGH